MEHLINFHAGHTIHHPERKYCFHGENFLAVIAHVLLIITVRE